MPTLNNKQRKLPNLAKGKSKSKSWSYHSIYHTTQWRRLRALKLNINPLCEQCEKQKMIEEATVVDHINPVQEGGEPFDLNNLQSLCKSHHNSKTAKSSRKNISNNNGIKGEGGQIP